MIEAANSANLIKGFEVASDAPSVSNLPFVDDSLNFCDADQDQGMTLKAILLCFEAVSGLKVNSFKSQIIGACVPDIRYVIWRT